MQIILNFFFKLSEVRHENVCSFYGILIDSYRTSFVFEYAPRGSLQNIIREKHDNLDWNFKWFMLNDLCRVFFIKNLLDLIKKLIF